MMEVRCERCRTLYEVDDLQVDEDGLTIRCAHCGQTFRVRKKSFVLTETVNPDEERVSLKKKDTQQSGWMVRKRDGSVQMFRELTTLQKWIVESRVSRDDEISRTGNNWKALGTISELASFFELVDQAASGKKLGAHGPTTEPLFSVKPSATGTGYPATAAPPLGPQVSAPGQGFVPDSTVNRTSPLPSLPPRAQSLPFVPESSSPAPAPGLAGLTAGAAPQTGGLEAGPQSWSEGESVVSSAPRDNVVEKWAKRGRRKMYTFCALLVLLAALGGWYLLRPDSFSSALGLLLGKQKEVTPEMALVQSGVAHALKDSEEELAVAIRDLTQAVRVSTLPEATIALAGVYVARAEHQLTWVGDWMEEISSINQMIFPLMNKPAKSLSENDRLLISRMVKSREGITTRLSEGDTKIKKDLDESRRLLESVRVRAVRDPSWLATRADLLRVKRAPRPEVESQLREAELVDPENPLVWMVRGALLGEEKAGVDQAIEKLNQALELQRKASRPDMVRARYKLAWLYAFQNKLEFARDQLDLILTQSPKHELATHLMEKINNPPEPDAAPPLAEPPPQAPPPRTATPKSGVAAPTSLDGWMKTATSLSRKGRFDSAIAAYDAALQLDPENAQALNGKGLVYVDMGAFQKAIAWFQRALMINEKSADAIMGIAESYKYLGDKEQAMEYYRRYLESFPDGVDAEVARRNLSQLK